MNERAEERRDSRPPIARPYGVEGASLKEAEEEAARAKEWERAQELRRQRQRIDQKDAEEILDGQGTGAPDAMLGLAKRLAEYKRFGLARRILDGVRPRIRRTDFPKIYVPVFQKSALYTYKDVDLPADWRLDRALDILGQAEDLARTEDQETLGLAGAIHKRKWEVDGQRRSLETAFYYYLRGYAMGLREDHVRSATAGAEQKETLVALRKDVLGYLRANRDCKLSAAEDQGYCGINAAFVLDLMAAEEEREARRVGIASPAAETKRLDANLIRAEITRSLPPLVEVEREDAPTSWMKRAWWVYATLGEAYFGLGADDPKNYAKSLDWLKERPRAAGLRVGLRRESPAAFVVPEWEYESSARQLARLALLRRRDGVSDEDFEKSEGVEILRKFLGSGEVQDEGEEVAARSALNGKVGLALSGGGMRSALYHIGVLARLAELDLLRHVEVLSCVSGGSIVGAHYYLEIRKLLETKVDQAITQGDYLEIVKRIEGQFLLGIQRNVRTRVLAGFWTNLKMAFVPGYSRTKRVGELYEREIFSRVEDAWSEEPCTRPKEGWPCGECEGCRVPVAERVPPVTGWRWVPDWLARRLGFHRQERWLDQLVIRPKTQASQPGGADFRDWEFRPRDHNWRRKHKAPILVLNATSLNTGHIWQFTSTYMGEPPNPIHTEIDSNDRLRRMYYRDAPPEFRHVRLGEAVAASSCVPGLFEPILFQGLYPADEEKLEEKQRFSVRLVDGGVCDNQGIGSLLEQDCSVVLVSDASGQMGIDRNPGGNPLGVVLRSSSVSQSRVREAQYTDIAARLRSSLLRASMFVHLRQELQGENIAWKDCPANQRVSTFGGQALAENRSTSYRIAASVQRKLAAMRTDLDSFSDLEAYALMASGYRMTVRQLQKTPLPGFSTPEMTGSWSFLGVEDAMKAGVDFERQRRHLERHLAAGASLAFRAFKLSRPLRWASLAILGVLALAGLIWLADFLAWHWGSSLVSRETAQAWTYGRVVIRLAAIAGVGLAGFGLRRLIGRKWGQAVLRAARWPETLRKVAIGVAMCLGGWALARLHLWVFDRIFLRLGRVDRLPR